MSWSKQVTIWCDGPNCGQWEQLSATVATAERELIGNGWKKKGKKHYCQSCQNVYAHKKLQGS